MLISLLVLLFALLLQASRDVPGWLQVLEALAIIFQGLLTPVLIAVGGGFAWYKFIRQGEHDPTLKPSVTATTTIQDGVIYVFATVAVQNEGNVEVEFTDERAKLTVFTTTTAAEDWLPRHTPVEVLRGQRTVRPGEAPEDQKLVQIEYGNEVAIRLDLAVTGKDAKGNTDTWDTVAIVSLLDG